VAGGYMKNCRVAKATEVKIKFIFWIWLGFPSKRRIKIMEKYLSAKKNCKLIWSKMYCGCR
jgi:hypothetical protein